MSKSIRVEDEDHIELKIRAAATGKAVPAIVHDLLQAVSRKRV